MLKLRMSGAIPPFTHMPSWYALGKPYLRWVKESRPWGKHVQIQLSTYKEVSWTVIKYSRPNLATTRLDRSWIIKYSRLSNSIYTDLHSLVILCYCS
jgi:hypothetical protein